MRKSLNLRPVEKGDAAFLHTLMNDEKVLKALHEVPTLLADWQEAISCWAQDGDEEDYILLVEGVPAGWLGINGLEGEEGTVYLKMAALLPAYQGRGMGSWAVEQIITLYRERNFRRILLYTDRENVPGRRCYEKCGFSVSDTLQDTMSDGAVVDRVEMKRVLR